MLFCLWTVWVLLATVLNICWSHIDPKFAEKAPQNWQGKEAHLCEKRFSHKSRQTQPLLNTVLDTLWSHHVAMLDPEHVFKSGFGAKIE